jgi:hypothetical protein
MVVRVAEPTTIFKNIQIMALIALIVVVQVTIKAIVTNWKINPTVAVVQVTMAVKEKEFLILTMLHSQKSSWKIILPMTCGFLIVEAVVITADPWKG